MAVEVRAPTTGIVVEVKTSVGAQVSSGDELVIIESMKMHIPVEAPQSGTVQEISVSEGQQINEDDMVLTLA